MPIALAADTSPPQLVDWGIVGGSADISKSDAIVVVRFILSDDSEIATPNLLLKSLSTTQMTSFATVKELSRSGKLVSYEASAVIKFGQSPRVWEWVLYPLRDALGNASTAFGPGVTWVSQINVTDATYTRDKAQCEGIVKQWNNLVSSIQLFESKYSGAQEIAIFRLRSQMPIEMLDIENCMTDAFIVKYTTNTNLANSVTAIGNIWYELRDKVVTRIQDELDAKQETEAKARAAKAAADKAAADLLTQQQVAAAAKAALLKKSTIICVKGKLSKTITAVKPVCPTGYKKK